MAVYLVDFENVSSAGISGIQKLTKEDKVYIFYTVNASTMSFAAHLNLLSSPAEVVYYNVSSGGKNALDFQLASFLGYLICQGKEKKFCIISNDRGFEYVKTFWERNGVSADISISGAPSINRALLPMEKPFSARIQQGANENAEPAIEEKIISKPAGQTAPRQMSSPAAPAKPAAQAVQTPVPQTPQTKTEDTAVPQTAQAQAAEETAKAPETPKAPEVAPKRRGRPPKNAAKTAEAPKQTSRQTAAKTGTSRQTSKTEPAKTDAKVKAEPQKPAETEAAKPGSGADTANNGGSKSHAGTAQEPPQNLRHALAKAGVTDEHDVSCVMDLLENTEGKQQFYRGILKIFGMERGVEIYKVVRPEYSNLNKLLNPSNG